MVKKILFLILSAAVIFGAVYFVQSYNKSISNSPSPQINKSGSDNASGTKINQEAVKVKAEDFKLKDLNGKEVSLSDFRGKNVYLNFWATWCPPCKAEMPDIEKLYQETKDSDLVILAVNLGEDDPTVKAFIEENKYNFRVLLDSKQNVAAKYNINAIPASFFINKDGTIISKKAGAMTLEEMKTYIKSL